MTDKRHAEFAALWQEAVEAANTAAEAENTRLPPEERRGFDCGFAWVVLPGNQPFARWASKQGIASKHYPKGMSIWYSKLHSVPTQSISVHQAAARAACEVFQRRLGTREIYAASRLD